VDCDNWIPAEKHCLAGIGGQGVVWATGKRIMVVDPEEHHWCAGFKNGNSKDSAKSAAPPVVVVY